MCFSPVVNLEVNFRRCFSGYAALKWKEELFLCPALVSVNIHEGMCPQWQLHTEPCCPCPSLHFRGTKSPGLGASHPPAGMEGEFSSLCRFDIQHEVIVQGTGFLSDQSNPNSTNTSWIAQLLYPWRKKER